MRCCLCSSPEGPFHIEHRHSGDDGRMEHWAFCEACRTELERQQAEYDPEICQRYAIFLQFVVGGYRMQRASQGNQSSRITP